MLENIGLALEALKSNKMRSLLTMLGIIIGITSVIAIITIGNALTSSISVQLESFGTNNVMVNVQERSQKESIRGPEETGISSQPEDGDLITDESIDLFKERYPEQVKGVSLSHSGGSATAKDGRLYANVNMTGVNEDYPVVNSVDMIKGRFIGEKDIEAYKNVAVISDKFAAKMFQAETDPIGQEIKVYGSDSIEVYTVVGVYKYEANSFFDASSSSEEDMSTNLYLPITTAKQTANLKNNSSFTVMLNQDIDTLAFTDEVENYFTEQYVNNTQWTVSVMNLGSTIDTVTNTLNLVSVAVAIIAGISLLVGGVGVMNIMLVSVTERTREIGTRKALGAKNIHIKMQFVVEAAIISIIGGLIGIILGAAIGVLAAMVLGTTATVSPMIVTLSVAFSLGIGIFFGYYPANKAAKLDPIEALRYE